MFQEIYQAKQFFLLCDSSPDFTGETLYKTVVIIILGQDAGQVILEYLTNDKTQAINHLSLVKNKANEMNKTHNEILNLQNQANI